MSEPCSFTIYRTSNGGRYIVTVEVSLAIFFRSLQVPMLSNTLEYLITLEP